MKKILMSLALFSSWSGVAGAQSPVPGQPGIPSGDLHTHNRVVAFGSVMLASGGSDVAQWKEVRVLSNCGNTDAPGIPDPQSPRAAACEEKLMVTTLYRFFECENGRAFLLRSGEGIIVRSRNQGEIFGWSEEASCGDGPLLTSIDTLDQSRPLDTEHLRFESR